MMVALDVWKLGDIARYAEAQHEPIGQPGRGPGQYHRGCVVGRDEVG